MNQRAPALSMIVKPGVTPSLLPADTVHFPGAGPSPVLGPVATSSTVSGLEPRIRLLNQLESGTSSMVLMLCARRFMSGSPGLPNRLLASS